MAATAKPTVTNAASTMCVAWVGTAALNIASKGRTSSSVPSAARVKPAGWFIHALAQITNTPEATPLTSTPTPDSQCRRGETRSQP